MIETVSKSRALEVVLASVPMSRHAAGELMHHLRNSRDNPSAVNAGDAASKVQVLRALDDLDVHHDYPKKTLLMRISQAKKTLRRIVENG